ncbi:MAG: MFS transporter [Firmicutes bacterium]|nr:MFS transporter [Alicyclobacillaceae bacterium]MCL6496373.1 MFS transporter [Bacillota bacterium]
MTREERGLFWSTSIGTLLCGMNTSGVATILPAIQRQLGVPYNTAQWLVTGYTLVLSGLLLPIGRLGDLWGHRRLYFSGLGIFTGCALLVGTLRVEWAMLGARMLQAVGAAAILASVPALLTATFAPSQRGRVLGLYAMNVYIGLSLGPFVGGWLAAVQGWPGLFWLSAPLFGVALILQRLGPPATPEPKVGAGRRFDWLGSLLLLAAFTSLLVGVNQGLADGWSFAWIALIVGAGGLGTLLVWVEQRVPNPLVVPRMLRDPGLGWNVAATFLNYVCTFFFFVLVPLNLVILHGWTEAQAGMVITVTPAVMVGVSSQSGRLSDRIGTRWPTVIGQGVLAAGLLAMSLLPARAIGEWVAALVAVGTGLGLFTAPNNSAIMGRVPRGMQGMASGMVGTARYAGQALGGAVATALFAAFHRAEPAALAFRHAMWLGVAVAMAGAWASWMGGAAGTDLAAEAVS